ncbi:MAG: type II toxin-antitoxin system RelB/DinJ family antitoxin [Finegoldia magna]|nr:type II toxin-antitoxin system RelB/DinJ family antitoxin [Finegoldia magna]
MSTVNLNIRTDKEIKEKAENIFQELGLNMTTAINMFLRTSIRENGIPFDLKIDSVNDETKLAIEEGRKIADEKTIEGYVSIEELKKALENLR